jgi:hypothetical protein
LASPQKVNLAEKLSLFDEHWSPKVVGELNGQQVKLVKLQGRFVWHHHDEEGRFRMEDQDRSVWIEEGEINRGTAWGGAQACRGGGGERAALRIGVNAEYRQCEGRDDRGGVGQDLRGGR